MNTEIEAKFLNISHDDIRAKLQQLGATCEAPMRLMRRAIIDYPDRRLQSADPSGYVRVRDEGDKVTLTFKQFTSLSVDGAQEIETTVASFDQTTQLLMAIGLKIESLQESKRETWTYQDCEIVLDEWPWLKPYLEIEGTSEAGLMAVAKDLGLDWDNAAYGDVMVAYRAQYPHLTDKETVGNLAEVKFGAPLPDFLTA